MLFGGGGNSGGVDGGVRRGAASADNLLGLSSSRLGGCGDAECDKLDELELGLDKEQVYNSSSIGESSSSNYDLKKSVLILLGTNPQMIKPLIIISAKTDKSSIRTSCLIYNIISSSPTQYPA